VVTSGGELVWARGFPVAAELAANEKTRLGVVIRRTDFVKSGGGASKTPNVVGRFPRGDCQESCGIRTADFESVGWKAVGCGDYVGTGALYLEQT